MSADADRACPHLGFDVTVEVNRITKDPSFDSEVIGYAADVQVRCSDCQQPFCWVGVPGGLSPDHPTRSSDETELRAPLWPESSGWALVRGERGQR